MHKTTTFPPFGTDYTPIMDYKIVGGKRVEIILTPRLSTSQGCNVKTTDESNEVLPGSSMISQQTFNDNQHVNLFNGYNTAQQHEIAREIASYTSPFGDRTQAFRHGAPTLLKHSILPPIGKSQPIGSDLKPVERVNLHHLRNEEDISDPSLEVTIAHSLRSFPSRKIKDIYVELSGFDRNLSGFVSEPQLSLVALRHNLPLKQSTMKILFQKFSDNSNDSKKVNYEKFLQFLSKCLSNPRLLDATIAKTRSSLRSSVMSEPRDVESTLFENVNSPTARFPVDDKLVVMLMEQLVGCCDLNINKLRKALRKADRLGNSELKADTILFACVNERLPLTNSMLTQLMRQAEITRGIVNWKHFLAPLEIAYNQLYPDFVPNDMISTSQDSRKYSLKMASLGSVQDDNESFQTDRSDLDRSSSNKLSRRYHLSAGWDENEPIGCEDPFISSNDLLLEQGNERPTLPKESWMHNFTRLSHALRNYHPFKKDKLPRAEVERIIANYNLIYNLRFSSPQILNAVERAVTTQSTQEKEQSVSIDYLLQILSGMAKDE